MRENQLRFFEDLMLGESEAAKEKNKKIHETFAVSLIEREKCSVLQYLRELRFHMPDENALVWTINTYFGRVIDLINRAYRFIENSIPALAKKRLPYVSAFTALQEILAFLEVEYGKYMDLHTCLPIPHEIQLKNALVTGFLHFKTSAQDANICVALLEIIESAYADFVEAKECGKTSYCRVFYYSTLISTLGKLSPLTDMAIQHTLIALNFNCPAFLKYYLLKLQQRPDTLTYNLKEINQTNVLPGLALNPLLPSAREQLNTWLSHEIWYLEKYSSCAGTSEPADDAEQARPRKITTGLSVPQLAYMLKLFADQGIIIHDNKTEMLETFAAMFRTEKTENISAGSLRKNFYNEDASVSRSVRDMLFSIINKSKGAI